MPVVVSEMSYAIRRVVADSAAKTAPTPTAVQRNDVGGHELVAGKTRENARKAAGMMHAATNVTRPQASVWIPVSTPPIPSTQTATESVCIAKRQFILLSGRARQT